MYAISALKLCLITHLEHPFFDEQYEQFILNVINAGVSSIQLRDKTAEPLTRRSKALALLSLLRPHNIPLIINDDVALAKEIDADGVHLGQSDKDPAQARLILGRDKIIGWSIESNEQLMHANTLSCIDYVAASAIFPSKTKTDCKTIWGLNGLKKIARLANHPVIAIGGINIGNIQEVINQGAYGAAVISALHDSPKPKEMAQALIQIISKGAASVSANK